MKNVKNRSKFHEKMAVFCHYLAMNGGSAKTNLPLLTLTSWVKGTSPFGVPRDPCNIVISREDPTPHPVIRYIWTAPNQKTYIPLHVILSFLTYLLLIYLNIINYPRVAFSLKKIWCCFYTLISLLVARAFPNIYGPFGFQCIQCSL